MSQTFHNLEAVSVPTEGEGERRQVPRFTLSREQFRLEENGQVFSVANVSPGGLSLRMLEPGDLARFPVGRTLEGHLRMGREKIPLKGRVRHLQPPLVGIEFVGGEIPLLSKLLDPQHLGQDLHPVVAADRGMIWYHGSSVDLIFRRGFDGQFHRVTLYYFGEFVQWDNDQGLITGTAHRTAMEAPLEVPQDGAVAFDTVVLRSDEAPDRNKLDIAKRIVLSSNLLQDLKTWCTRRFAPTAVGN